MALITEIWFIRMHIMSETLCVSPFRKAHFHHNSRFQGTDLWGSHESIGAEGKWLCSSGAPRTSVLSFLIYIYIDKGVGKYRHHGHVGRFRMCRLCFMMIPSFFQYSDTVI